LEETVQLEWRQLDNSFACEVLGLCLWEPQDDRTIDEVRNLWALHPVLVFRRQALSEDELANFSARFGPLERTVRTDWASPARPEVGLISNLKDAQAKPIGGLGDGEIQWHSDQSYMLNPATGAMLYALELPPEGGATSWVDLSAAYAGLPDRLKQAVEPSARRRRSCIRWCMRTPSRAEGRCTSIPRRRSVLKEWTKHRARRCSRRFTSLRRAPSSPIATTGKSATRYCGTMVSQCTAGNHLTRWRGA
jgi:hypothetical protein